MKQIGYQGICILLSLIFIVGCIDLGDEPRNPREGDLSFTIQMDQLNYITTPDSIIVKIILENVCSDVLLIEKYFTFSATLSENITGPEGNRIQLSYPIFDYEPIYSNIEPGENISAEMDLLYYGSEIVMGDDHLDFNWDREGQYTINLCYNTLKKNGGHLSVRSNLIIFYLHD